MTGYSRLASAAAAALLVTLLGGCSKNGHESPAPGPVALLGTPGSASTSRADLERTSTAMRARLTAQPTDAKAAVLLADALLRLTRVSGNAGLAVNAEEVLKTVLAQGAANYEARRMLAATLLSQHRFREALAQANACLIMRTNDAWLYGAIGDAHVELGDYDAAFEAFDRMAALKPNAAAYARASYARELQGDLAGALKLMKMAAEATAPQDPESLAWHHAQLGHLYLELGQLANARTEFAHAEYAFPGHPFASDGLARVKAAEGDFAGALSLIESRLSAAPAPAELAFAGDVLAAMGRADEAERSYRLAEAAWRSDAPEPAKLARFQVEHGRHLHEAVRLAEQLAADRRDIFTEDALAWAYFQTGQLDRARATIARALRTGSRDRTIRYHAAAIAAAAGDRAGARALVHDALDGAAHFDLISAPAAAALRAALGAS